MKWKTALTAEEATLLWAGLNSYRTIQDAYRDLSEKDTHLLEHLFSKETPPPDLRRPDLGSIHGIYRALIFDIGVLCGLDEDAQDDRASCLVLADDRANKELLPENCRVTKNSLGHWFAQFGLQGKAQIFCSNDDVQLSNLNASKRYFWRTKLTAEQVALATIPVNESYPIPINVHEWADFDAVEARLINLSHTIISDTGDLEREFLDFTVSDRIRELDSSLYNAKELHRELLKEIDDLVTNINGTASSSSVLVLATYNYLDDDKGKLNPPACTVTKPSIAEWFRQRGDDETAEIFQQTIFHKDLSVKGADEAANNYPAKLQLAISAHKYFWGEEGASVSPSGSDVEAWLHQEAIRLEITHYDGKPTAGISNKVKDVITQIIKPD